MNRVRPIWTKKLSKGMRQHKASRMIWGLAALVLCLCVLALSSGYLNYVKGTIRRDAKGNLKELGDHIAQSLYNEISGTGDVLGSLALEVAQRDMDTDEKRVEFLSKQADFWNFYDLAVIDKDGISCHQDGRKDVSLNRRLLSDALNTETITFDFLIAGGEDCVIFCAPVPEELREASGYLAISGTYAVDNWNMLMDISVFGGEAVTQIISKEGVVITRGRGNEGQSYYNLLDYLNKAEFEPGITLETIKNTLQAEESVQFSYRLDGTEYYLSCAPIGFYGWGLVFTVPTTIVNNAGNQMARSVIIISAVLTMIFLLVLFCFRESQRQAQKRIWAAAYVDDVTGGANRHKFMLDVPAILARHGTDYVLVYTNIDQFKIVNQRYGSAEADDILCHIHDALMAVITERECCARLTADHFVLLMQKDGVEERLKTVVEEQTVQTTQAGGICEIRLTFGLCPVESSDHELTELIDRANLAIKMSPVTENGIAVYDDSMMERAAREKALTERMRQESFGAEFTIYLQPKVDLVTGAVVGAEALARWISKEFGFVSPGEFIPLAEKAGIVCQIDWRAFELVCETIARWQVEGRKLVPISFNLSKAQLSIPGFLETYREIIRRCEISCRYLDFEFTESLLYENSGALQAAVREIHEMGAWCSMDDFGFGYSSLGLLGQFEADTLKLDRSFFMEDAEPESRNNRIVRSVIQIAESLGMHTVAEGVENEKHVDMLRQFGCDSIQGYYYSKPLPVLEFEKFVDERTIR